MRDTFRMACRVALAAWVTVVGCATLATAPSTIAAASSTWYWQNPLPRAHSMQAISCPWVKECIAVGYTTAPSDVASGDSVLAPRGIPHVWASVGNQGGGILVAFQPAGLVEAFFRVVTASDAMPPQDPKLWRAHALTHTVEWSEADWSRRA